MAGSPLDAAREVADTMSRTSATLRSATKASLAGASKVSRSVMLKQASGSAGGDRVFSNFAKAGGLTVKTRQSAGELTVSPKGPWKIPQEGAAPHRIGKRGLHPGTKSSQGRKSWTQGQASIFEQLGRTIPDDIETAVSEAFGG